MCSHLNLLYADRMAMVIISTQLSFPRHKAGNASEDGPALFNEEWELGEVCLSVIFPALLALASAWHGCAWAAPTQRMGLAGHRATGSKRRCDASPTSKAGGVGVRSCSTRALCIIGPCTSLAE